MIYEKGRAFPKDAGMGTTVVAAIVDSKSMTVAHVGDSRLYLWRRGELTQLTEDHSLVGEQVKARPDHRRRGRALTSAEHPDPGPRRGKGRRRSTWRSIPFFPGDLVLLATDGLSKMVVDADVAAVIAESLSPQRIVDALIAKSRAAGGVDNIAIVVARVPAVGGRRRRS